MSSQRLWVDVPESERINAAFLDRCGGSIDPDWVANQLHRAAHPRCEMAVPWFGNPDVWAPCGVSPLGGARFCFHHGGPSRPKIDKEAALLRRLERERGTVVDEIEVLKHRLWKLEAAIQAVQPRKSPAKMAPSHRLDKTV